MTIAVNTRLWIEGSLEGIGYYTKEVALLLATNHPQHRFHFLFDRLFAPTTPLPPNVTVHIISPPARHPLLWKFWFDVKVPLLLRKIRADVFLSPDGQCSLTTAVPQCLVVHDLAFLYHRASYPTLHYRYYKHFTPRFISKAVTIVTVSEFSKQDIVHQYTTPPEKITVAGNGAKPIFKPLAFDDQDEVRDKYTGGAAYFLYVGAIQPRKNLLQLLKAFSAFKKRLQSSMKLVLAGRLAWRSEAFTTLLATYKHKADVVLTGYVKEEELAPLMGAAYALVYPSLYEGFGVPVLEAMQSGVPVISSENSAMQEVAGDAALYVNPTDIASIADGLMRMYKDESNRKALIEKGLLQAQRFSWQASAGAVWQAIAAAAAKAKSPGGDSINVQGEDAPHSNATSPIAQQ